MKLTPDTAKVGDGATFSLGSDRTAGTIVKLSPSGKTLTWQGDDYEIEWADNAHYGDYPLDVIYSRNTKQATTTYRWSEKFGCYKTGSRYLGAGRNYYRDPSF